MQISSECTVINHLESTYIYCLMDSEEDLQDYRRAVKELICHPVVGSSGTYHVKNGIIHYGYDTVPIRGFSNSQHFWEIMH